uniref:Peptidase M60 domain-containing protein n=1 Tax=Naja naja TaxID=35670 RepID=A0A8C6XBC9_NAJNA
MSSTHNFHTNIRGILSIDVTGDFNPCELLLTGDQAFPVLVDSKGQVLIAASQYGKGRMVVTAHESMLMLPQFLLFIKNALTWLRPSPTALIGVHRSLDALSKLLLSNGIKVQSDATPGDSLGVFCRDAYENVQADELVEFVKQGGGLLIGGQAWHWSYQHGKEAVLVRFPGNLLTSVAGVYFTGNVGENGVFSVPEKIPRIPLITEHGLDIQRDLQTLLKGVERFNVKGDDLQNEMLPSSLLIHGALAFPVGISDTYHSFLAAAYYGRGRIVVASHEGFLKISSMKTFLLNAITWLSAGKERKVGIGDSLRKLYSMLNQAKIPCELTNFKEGLGIYCCTAYDAKEMKSIHEFVSEGGGLLIGGQSWHWASMNPDSSAIAKYPGNKILNKFGIGITQNSFEVAGNSCPAGEPSEVASTYLFRKALLKFKEHIRNEQILQTPYSLWLQRLAQDIGIFLEIPATNAHPFSSIHEDTLELVQIKGIPEVSVHNPIQADSDQAILLQIASVLYNVLPEFQGLVPSLMPYDPSSYPTASPQNIQVNGRNETWRSTGMYAPPATTVTLLFPPSTLNTKLQVQIGCHADSLVKHEKWKRPPVVTRRFPVQREKMEISSLWGGLLYIIVPENSSLGYFSVTIKGATQAPYFKHGKTTPSSIYEDWQDTIRHYPAPWAELETENIILTLPSDAVRSHDGIAFLLQTWDQMMRAIAHLAAIPPVFPRPERIVADVQISAGWMHAGYPVMSNVGALPEIIDGRAFYAKGTWGPIHELGHNQQKSGWNFPPHTTEATCNLWSVYVNETVLSISREIAHSDLQPHARKERIKNYIRNGANLDDFEVFTALEPYLQLQEAFGWDPYIHILAKYQTMSNIPHDNRSKMNLWAETFSQEVNRNLGPFFKTWGWPIEDRVSENLAISYPAWAEDPMIQYRHS